MTIHLFVFYLYLAELEIIHVRLNNKSHYSVQP